VNRYQQHLIDYVQEDVRELKEVHQGKQLRFSDEQLCPIAVKVKKLQFSLLGEIARIVSPQTRLRWHRPLIAQEYYSSRLRKPGRPRRAERSRELVIRTAVENQLWEYRRISGALYYLG